MMKDPQGEKLWHCKGTSGSSLLQTGLQQGVPIESSCGGNGECSNCHIYVDPDLLKSPYYRGPSQKESDVLDFVRDVKENSRLACQMKICEDFRGKAFQFANYEML